MLKTLCPKVLATLTLATTVGVSGCVYPLARGSAAKVDEAFAAYAVAEAPADAPQNQIVQVQHTEKPLPPFARFFGGFFGKGRPEQQPVAEPPEQQMPAENGPSLNAPESTAPALAAPANQNAPQVFVESQRRASEIVPAADLMNPQPSQRTEPPATSRRAVASSNGTVMRIGDEAPHQPVPTTERQADLKPEPPTETAMPVIVSPNSTSANDMPDVVSRFSEKAAKIVSASPQERSTDKFESTDAMTNKPVPLKDQIEGMTKSPWSKTDLLKRAKNNSSTQSTTLTHALEIALDSMKDPASQPAPKATERTLPAREETAVKTPSASALLEQRLTPAQPISAHSTNGTPSTSLGSAANPLRSSGGKTDWSGMSGTDQTPQTITNNTLSTYPKTNPKWTPSLFASTSSGEPADDIVENPTPPTEPATTVNPYATAPEGDTTPSKSVQATPAKPMVVTNELAVPEPITKPANPTDAVHFESSLLGKLKAAGQEIDWGPETPTKEEPSPEAAMAAEAPPVAEEMPQVVEGNSQERGLPLVNVPPVQKEPEASGGIVRSAIEPEKEPTPQPGMMGPSPGSESAVQPAKPFVVSAAVPSASKSTTRSGTQRGVLIRPAEKTPTPHVIRQNAKGWHTTDSVPVNQSEIPSRSPSGSGSRTYIID